MEETIFCLAQNTALQAQTFMRQSVLLTSKKGWNTLSLFCTFFCLQKNETSACQPVSISFSGKLVLTLFSGKNVRSSSSASTVTAYVTPERLLSAWTLTRADVWCKMHRNIMPKLRVSLAFQYLRDKQLRESRLLDGCLLCFPPAHDFDFTRKWRRSEAWSLCSIGL